MFRTESSTSKMPVNRSIQHTCEAVSNDFKAKERMKAKSDHKFKATNSSLSVGDRVYLRNANQAGKSATVYDPNPYTVQRIAGTQAVIARDRQILRRNLSMLKRVIEERSDVPVMLAAATRRSTKIIFSTKVQMTPMVDTNEREDELLSNSEPIDRNASPPNPTVLLVDPEVNSAEEEVPFIAATSPTTGDGSDQNRETAPTTEVSPQKNKTTIILSSQSFPCGRL